MKSETDLCVFVDTGSFDTGDISWPPGIQGLEIIRYEQTMPGELHARVSAATVIVTNKVRLDREMLQQLPGLRLVCIAATGTNNVDLEAAAELGVRVCNVTAYATASVVEHVFALMLSLLRKLPRYNSLATAGAWTASPQFCVLDEPLSQLQGKVLGIVGYGELGQHVAMVARAFGMEILVAERKQATRVRADRVSFEQMLAQADVISLHCPLSVETTNLFTQTEFAAMKPGAILINTARGGIVNEQDLLQALKSGSIAAAALDVLEREPPPGDHPLLAYDGNNLLITPHVAWASAEARQQLLDGVFDNISHWLSGDPVNLVSG